MKNFKKNTIIIFLLTILVLYFLLKDDFNSIMHELVHVNHLWILVAVFSFLAYLLFKAESLRIVAVKNYKDFTLKKSFLQVLIVTFFNGVTPFQTGGQPMQIYMLKKNNLSVSKASNIVIQEFIFYQVALVLLGLVAVVLNYFCHFFPKVHLLQVLVVFGFIFNVIVVLGLLLVSFNRKITNFLLKGSARVLAKIHIIKDKEKALKKIDTRLNDFHENAIYLLSNRKMFIKGIVVNFIGLLFFYITPLFVAYGFGISHINVIEVITASAYIYLVGSFVPFPGATGGLEYSFMQFFGNFINGASLPAILIIYRTITYYLPIMIGAFVFNFYKGDGKA